MGRRHHHTPKRAATEKDWRTDLEREFREAKDPQAQTVSPWGPGWAPVVHSTLAVTYRYLMAEWPQYIEVIERRLADSDKRMNAMERRGKGHTDAFARLYDDSVDDALMLRDVRGLLRTATQVSAALAEVRPTWVPATATAVLAEIDADVRHTDTLSTDTLSGLGPSGLLLFEEPQAYVQEVLGSGMPTMPEVTVDALLWRPWGPMPAGSADGRARRVPEMVLHALTRSRALQPLRSEGWKRSVLTEATVIDIFHGMRVADNLTPVVELAIKLAHAMGDNRLRPQTMPTASAGVTVLQAA
ncbi:hypothetical protein ACPXB3_11780 [Gordonia sp. DT219]|uniref:hypothetical protein n=1 Tax=Gordonia sp. DT219 TaxID=3416658 RepID=UPI003CFAF9C7